MKRGKKQGESCESGESEIEYALLCMSTCNMSGDHELGQTSVTSRMTHFSN